MREIVIKMAQVIVCNSCGKKCITITVGSNKSKAECTSCGGTIFHYREVSSNDV